MPISHRPTSSPVWVAGLGLLALTAGTLAAELPGQALSANISELAEPITEGQRVFTCGHSFHVWVPGIVADLCKKAGIPGHIQIGVSSIGGSRVIQHWDIARENKAKDALQTGMVDVLTVTDLSARSGHREFHHLGLEA